MKRFLFLVVLILTSILQSYSQSFKNPIIPGYHPDPSVCRAGDDFYLVNSSFCYFPGVPIFKSKDLINWEQIGNCLTRKEQLDLNNTNFWLGIYAPTIRYHDGTFYMIVTNVVPNGGGNFIVYTDNPAGEWSNPVWLKQGGIDPSLFWENGKCYMVSNPDDGIFLCEINPKTGEQLSDSKRIWNGTGGRYPEAPHIYKKDGWYYLMIAEGGTEYGHKVTIARSKNIEGPYLGNPSNPILTHINQNAQGNPIQGTGHADLVQAADSSWWLVCLGFRPQAGSHHLLGRETFLAKVDWPKNGWPVVNGDGQIYTNNYCETLPLKPVAKLPEKTVFNKKTLTPDWIFLRNPITENYVLDGKKLTLKASYQGLETNQSPTFLIHRVEKFDFEESAPIEPENFQDGDEAGLSMFMSEWSHYDIFVTKNGKQNYVNVRYRLNSLLHTEKQIAVPDGKIFLKIVGSKEYFTFYYSTDGKKYNELCKMNTIYLSTETAGGFTGIVTGIYAAKNSQNSKAQAKVEWFELK